MSLAPLLCVPFHVVLRRPRPDGSGVAPAGPSQGWCSPAVRTMLRVVGRGLRAQRPAASTQRALLGANLGPRPLRVWVQTEPDPRMAQLMTLRNTTSLDLSQVMAGLKERAMLPGWGPQETQPRGLLWSPNHFQLPWSPSLQSRPPFTSFLQSPVGVAACQQDREREDLMSSQKYLPSHHEAPPYWWGTTITQNIVKTARLSDIPLTLETFFLSFHYLILTSR